MRNIPVSGKIFAEEEKQAVLNWLASGEEIAHGKFYEQFERMLATYIGMPHAFYVNSGSSANLLAFAAFTSPNTPEHLRVKPGDEIITLAASFPTTVAPIVQYGCVPVFVDIDIPTYNIKVEDLEKALSSKTKGVFIAHTLGNPFDVYAVIEFCNKHGLWLIEDNCLVGDTMILTDRGEIKLSDINIGDNVWTRQGYKPIINIKRKQVDHVITALGLTGTDDHPIITTRGTKKLKDITYTDRGYVWNQQKSCLMETYIADIQILLDGICEYITGVVAGKTELLCIEEYGNTITALLKRDTKYTIKTRTLLTTILLILNYYHAQSIIRCTLSTTINSWIRSLKTCLWRVRGLKNGMQASKEENGILSMGKKVGMVDKLFQKYVKYAVQNIKHIFLNDLNFVQNPVKVEQERLEKPHTVYDITVKDAHEYIANNVLVHNCDAMGSRYHGVKTGSFGHISTTSFYPAHHMSTGGGGAVFTFDSDLAAVIRSLRGWGKKCHCAINQDNACGKRFDWKFKDLPDGYDHKYVFSEFGYNLTGTNIQAAIGVEQIKKLPAFTEARHRNFDLLDSLLQDVDFIHPIATVDSEPSWFGYPILLTKHDRKAVIAKLNERGVNTRLLFAGNITRQPCFTTSNVPYRIATDLTNTDNVLNNLFWIGCWHGLTEEDIRYEAEVVKEVLQ